MNEYTIALFFHLLGVLMFVAGIVVAGVAFEFARRQPRLEAILLVLSLTRAGVGLVGIGTLLVGGFGLWLVHLGHFGYGTGWVSAAIALYVVALILGGLGGQRPKQARRLAAELSGESDGAVGQVRALLGDPLSRAANYLSLLVILAILAIMVFKP